MATVHLHVEPVFCGPASVGTVGLIKLLQSRFGLSLAEAKVLVDRCVFARQTVALAASAEAAEVFAREVDGLVSPATFRVRVEA